MDILFLLANLYVLPFWFLMVVLPKKKFTATLMASVLIFIPLTLLYIYLLLFNIGEVAAAFSNPTLENIGVLLSVPGAALLGWVHFLAFDLFVARWMYLDSRKKEIHPLIMVVPLLFTLMAGPSGLPIYLALRLTKKDKLRAS